MSEFYCLIDSWFIECYLPEYVVDYTLHVACNGKINFCVLSIVFVHLYMQHIWYIMS